MKTLGIILLVFALVAALKCKAEAAEDLAKKDCLVLGIDQDTTYSVAGVWNKNLKKVDIIENSIGKNITPSYVYYPNIINDQEKTGEQLVGQIAKDYSLDQPMQTIFAAKRLIGKKWTYDAEFLGVEQQILPYKLIEEDGESEPVIIVRQNGNNLRLTPEDIASEILKKLKMEAEKKLGKDIIKYAVITVPAYFDSTQMKKTIQAGEKAGFEIKKILKEPTAAAIAYGLTKKDVGTICIIDFGGGTFDVSILSNKEGVMKVLSTDGDSYLGGEDFDKAIINLWIDVFQKKHGIRISENSNVWSKLKKYAEQAKISLSKEFTKTINIDQFIKDEETGEWIPFHHTIQRAKFDAICDKIFDKMIGPIKAALINAKVKAEFIDKILLVGGSTRIPRIREKIKELFFNRKLTDIGEDDDVEEAVAKGAAILGNLYCPVAEPEKIEYDRTHVSYGIRVNGNRMDANKVDVLVFKNSPMPITVHKQYQVNTNNKNAGQAFVWIDVYFGEKSFYKQNEPIEKNDSNFKLKFPRSKGKKEYDILVTFSISNDAKLKVTATEFLSKKFESKTWQLKKDYIEIKTLIENLDKEAEEANEIAERKKRIESLEDYLKDIRNIQIKINEPNHFVAKTYMFKGIQLEEINNRLQIEKNWLKNIKNSSLGTEKKILEDIIDRHIDIKKVIDEIKKIAYERMIQYNIHNRPNIEKPIVSSKETEDENEEKDL